MLQIHIVFGQAPSDKCPQETCQLDSSTCIIHSWSNFSTRLVPARTDENTKLGFYRWCIRSKQNRQRFEYMQLDIHHWQWPNTPNYNYCVARLIHWKHSYIDILWWWQQKKKAGAGRMVILFASYFQYVLHYLHGSHSDPVWLDNGAVVAKQENIKSPHMLHNSKAC